MSRQYSHVLWDWNGTLFDDLWWCMRTINDMLRRRRLPQLETKAYYHRAFCFPIIDYYRNVGFDFEQESFDVLAKEYMNLYHSNATGHSGLHEYARIVMATIQKMGMHQVILSASRTDHLIQQVRRFDIERYLDELLGLSDIYAASKVDIGLEYMQRAHCTKAVMIGDTVHDYEVAKALGVDCLLIANGHQSRAALNMCCVPVLSDVFEVLDYV